MHHLLGHINQDKKRRKSKDKDSTVNKTEYQSKSFPPNYVNLYEQKPKAIKSFGIRISPLLESANIKPQNIEKTFYTKYSSLVHETT